MRTHSDRPLQHVVVLHLSRLGDDAVPSWSGRGEPSGLKLTTVNSCRGHLFAQVVGTRNIYSLWNLEFAKSVPLNLLASCT